MSGQSNQEAGAFGGLLEEPKQSLVVSEQQAVVNGQTGPHWNWNLPSKQQGKGATAFRQQRVGSQVDPNW